MAMIVGYVIMTAESIHWKSHMVGWVERTHTRCSWMYVRPPLWTARHRAAHSGFVPDTEGKQEPPTQHRRGWGVTCCHHSTSPTTFTKDWLQSPQKAWIRDSHHGLTAGYDPPSDNLRSRALVSREGSVTAASPLPWVVLQWQRQ